MRRTVHYMGRSFTQRHLNACCSPLLTGFVRPNAFSSTKHGLVASPLCGIGCMGGSGAACANGGLAAVSEAALSQLLTAMNTPGKSISVLVNLACIQNISTCVCAWVRVLVGLMLRCFHPAPRDPLGGADATVLLALKD
ncbi:hypothetical protein CUR178_03323 [Leishmania enriettii]|uniref:Uncharacterized protein n=1 Tax=Leishmania enriettii TaxID=5663 RepID=A0A836GCR6_LEIEN|nr:hypothetical protein CUR178_03323 [Leishmania enriettii]